MKPGEVEGPKRIRYRRKALIVFLIFGLFNLSGCSKKIDSDEAVLFQLKKAGSDLSKPHEIDFYLYLPAQAAAEEAATRLKSSGFAVKVRASASDTNWLCLATKTMIPELSSLHKAGQEFEALASALGGNYDGWETAVVK